MNTEKINQLTGRELDAIIFEKVYGARWYRSSATGRRALFTEPPIWFRELAKGDEELATDWDVATPRYSTDIRIAEKLWERIGRPTIENGRDGVIWVSIKRDYMGALEVAEGSTLSEAIARAAVMMAKGGKSQ